MIQALDVDKAESWPDGRIAREAKRYPSDLTDEEWERIAPLMPKPGRSVLRTMMDAIIIPNPAVAIWACAG
jgi:hypothetical protein